MRLVSFNPFRSLGLPGVTHVKPDRVFEALDVVRAADRLLFPETWMVNFLAYGVRRPLFPSPAAYHLGRDKVEMTRAFWSVAPGCVPHTLILPAGAEGVERAADELGFPLVVKEPRSSMGRGVHLLRDRRELTAWTAGQELLYAQEYVAAERDLRVVVVGDRAVAAYWRAGGDGFLHNVARGGELDFDAVPPEAVALAETVALELGIDHAGFDLLWVDGRPLLLELNVMFGTRGLAAAGVDLAPVILDWLRRTAAEPPPAVPAPAPELRLAG